MSNDYNDDNPFLVAQQGDDPGAAAAAPAPDAATQQQLAEAQQLALSQMTAEQQAQYAAMTPDQQIAYLQQYMAALHEQAAGAQPAADAAAQQQLAETQQLALSQMTAEQQAQYMAMPDDQKMAYLQQYMSALQEQQVSATAQPAVDPAYQERLAQAQNLAFSQMTPDQQAQYMAMPDDQKMAYLDQYLSALEAQAAAVEQAPEPEPAKPQPPAQPSPPVDLDPNEDFEGDLARSKQKNKMIVIGIVAAVLIIGGGIYAMTGSSSIAETVEEETPQETADFVMAPPDWKPLPTVAVQIASDPPGANVVINGHLKKGVQTPSAFDFIDGRANTVSVFKDGFLPSHTFIPDGSIDITQVFSVTLQAIPEPPPPPTPEELAAQKADYEAKKKKDPNMMPPPEPEPYDPDKYLSEVLLGTSDPEQKGVKIWINGRDIGDQPAKIKVARNAIHHALFEQEGMAPHVVVFEPTLPLHRVDVMMSGGVFIDRTTALKTEPSPQTATVEYNDTPGMGKAMLTFPKGDLIRLAFNLEEYEPYQYSIDTAAAGSFEIKPILRKYRKGKSRVRWITPEGEYWYACLKGKADSVCWDDKFSREARPVPAGTYNVKAWEQLSGSGSNRRWGKNQPEVTLEPGFGYEIQLTLGADDTVDVVLGEPLPLPPEEGEEGETPAAPE